MKRFGVITLATAALAVGPAAATFAGAAVRGAGVHGARAGAATVSDATAPRSQLTTFACQTALAPADRSISVRAVMRPLPNTQRMQMRFELLSKLTPTAAVQSVPGTGLGVWISPPNPTLGQLPRDVWVVKDFRVADLPAPRTYRYQVSFRWFRSGGRVTIRKRLSPRCTQPELRPDLVVGSIAVQPIPGKPAKDQYMAAIENQGRTAAGMFTVTFAPGGGAVTLTKTLVHLAAGATREVTFVGPACTASTAPTIVADPNETVDEPSYANNSLSVLPVCPPLTIAPVVVG